MTSHRIIRLSTAPLPLISSACSNAFARLIAASSLACSTEVAAAAIAPITLFAPLALEESLFVIGDVAIPEGVSPLR